MTPTAPTWQVAEWLNVASPLTLAGLRGLVVVAGAFQMLCPGCVAHLLPQLGRVHETFATMGVQVVGLHTVFEHHAAMTPLALRAFVHEYRIIFPVGIDQPGPAGEPLPETMRAYAMQGTPTLLLYDRRGGLRGQIFGPIPDLRLGAEIMALLGERADDAG